MNLQSIPALVIAGITFYVGIYHLTLFGRLPGKKEHFSFALICLAIGFYDLFSAGLYNSLSPGESAGWQKAQITAVCLAATFCLWFFYHNNPLMSKKWVWIFTIVHLVFAGVMGFERSGLTWTDVSDYKEIVLPFGFSVNYYESAPGPLMYLFISLEVLTIGFALWSGLKLIGNGDPTRARPLLIAFMVFFAGIAHDMAIVLGIIESVYLIEYTFLALILLMAYLLSNQIVKSASVQDALAESEHRFSTAFRSNPGAMSIDRAGDGKYVDVNDSFTSMFGYSREEAVGRTSLDLNIWADMPDQYYERDRLLKSQGAVRDFEYTFRRKGGQTGTGINSVGMIELSGLPHIISISHDITEWKQAQEEKELLERRLHQSRKMEAIGTLASGIAHDFNNILQTITGYTQLLLRKNDLRPESGHFLSEVEQAVERATDLTRRLLTFGRKVEPEYKIIDLNGTVERIIGILERTIPKMIRIETSLADAFLSIEADPNQLERVLLNLGANARDAMPNGGRISIQTENISIDVDTPNGMELKPGRYVLLSFSDTGQGMDPVTQSRIFDPFFTTKKPGQGTGLGMSTTYGIIKAHRGHITCRSAPGQGTTFNIFLPVHSQSASPKDGRRHPVENQALSGSETILLVDDEETIIETVRDLLENNGYKIITAESGENALQVYRQSGHKIDMVILDLGMPGMGGYNCLSRLIEMDPKAKVLIVSGYAAETQVRKAVAAGAVDFIAKPFKLADISKKVRDILDIPPTTP